MTILDHCHTCPKILRSTNACFRPEVVLSGNYLEAGWELFMSFSSFFPYFLFLATVLFSISRRTTRGLCVFVFLSMQHVLCEGIKMGIAQARPPGACSTSFGLPSNHSSFATSLSTWLLLEWVIFEKHAPFKAWKYHNLLRNSFLLFAPFIIISRHHLNYHTPGQILAGMSVGFICASSVFAMMYYTIVNRFDYSNSLIVKIWTFLKFQDNLSYKQKQLEKTAESAGLKTKTQ